MLNNRIEMKRLNKYFIATVLVFTISATQHIYAKLKQTPVYVYGFAASFNDSTVYFTDIQSIESAWLYEKTNFLYGRDMYSYQLRDYLKQENIPYPTCVTSFATTKEKAEKHLLKFRKKYLNKGNYNIKYLNSSEFKYTPVTPDEETLEREGTQPISYPKKK